MSRIRTISSLGSVIAAAAVAGCSTFSSWNFDADARSSQPVGEVRLLVPVGAKGQMNVPAELAAFERGAQAYAQSCSPRTEVAPIVAALLPVVGEMLFGFAVDHANRRVAELKEASQASYAARQALTVGQLRAIAKSNECLVVLRFAPANAEGKAEPSMVAVFRLSLASEAAPGAIAMQPVYVAAKSSAALTRAAPDAAVAIGLAVSLKGIGIQQSTGLPVLAVIGEGSSAAPKVSLGGTAACVSKPCAMSEPIPLLRDDRSMVVLGVGVSEKGSLGFDIDVAQAQFGAVKAAIGPVINDLIKAKVSPE